MESDKLLTKVYEAVSKVSNNTPIWQLTQSLTANRGS